MVKPARLDMMTIKSQISEADIPRISLGQKAYFTIFSDPDKRHDIEVRTIEPASETTHSVEPPLLPFPVSRMLQTITTRSRMCPILIIGYLLV